MASLRDSRGRFVKAAASNPLGVDAAVSAPPSPSQPLSIERIAMDQQQLLDRLVAQYENAARENEARMKAAVDRYEQLMQSTQASLEGLLANQAAQSPSGTAGVPQLPPPAPPPPPQESGPAAVWIKAPDGENFLLVNQAGAVMFLAIFERMGMVFKELEKLAPKRPGR